MNVIIILSQGSAAVFFSWESKIINNVFSLLDWIDTNSFSSKTFTVQNVSIWNACWSLKHPRTFANCGQIWYTRRLPRDVHSDRSENCQKKNQKQKKQVLYTISDTKHWNFWRRRFLRINKNRKSIAQTVASFDE